MKKALRGKLDKIWGVVVKERDRWCQRHIGKDFSFKQDAHHIITRSKGDRLRWDVINGILLCCIPCHRWDRRNGQAAHDDMKAFEKWFRKTNPKKWRYLKRQEKKGIIQFKDHHYELIKNAIETLTPIAKIEKLL